MDLLSHVKSIDCDVHPSVPGMRALMPYLEDFWRDSVEERGIASLDSISYPPNAPISARPDFRAPPSYLGRAIAYGVDGVAVSSPSPLVG
jgi:uncharacterized protein